jgi:hypothetical protein
MSRKRHQLQITITMICVAEKAVRCTWSARSLSSWRRCELVYLVGRFSALLVLPRQGKKLSGTD